MPEDFKGKIERPYAPDIGKSLWKRALRRYADPSLRREIEAAGGLNKLLQLRKGARDIPMMSTDHFAIAKQIEFFLIAEAAQHLHSTSTGRISALNIATLLKTDTFSISPMTVRKYLREHPSLVENYGLSVRTREDRHHAYAEAIRDLWAKSGRKPSFESIAKKLNLSPSAVGQMLSEKSRRSTPSWLITLYETGHSNQPGTLQATPAEVIQQPPVPEMPSPSNEPNQPEKLTRLLDTIKQLYRDDPTSKISIQEIAIIMNTGKNRRHKSYVLEKNVRALLPILKATYPEEFAIYARNLKED